MQNHLSNNFMSKIAQVMKLAQKQIVQILANYQYKDELTHEDNMNELIDKLQASVFQKNILINFRQYIKISDNIPIQVNFKPLRFQQLVLIFDQWLIHDGQRSASYFQRRNTTINWRNDLFRRVCLEQKQTIDDFFKINSKKRGIAQIKGFDLYQLLGLILSDYYLYEKYEDKQVYFDKENSFNSFTKLVQVYENDDKRLNFLHKNSTEIDRQYIQRFQFQKFLQYWQTTNHELTLRDTIRKNLQSVQTQTHSVLTNSIAIQTSRSRISSLKAIINNTLHEMNILFEKQSNGRILQEMECIFDFLKMQKIKLLQCEDEGNGTDQQSNKRNHDKTKSKNKNHVQEEKKTAREYKEKLSNKNVQNRYGPTKFNPLTPSPLKRAKYQIPKQQYEPRVHFNQTSPLQFAHFSPMVQKIHQYEDSRNNFAYEKVLATNPKHILLLIFSNYSQQSEFLDINQLNHFFYQFGIINFGQTYLIMNLMEHHLITNADHITFKDFQIIITELMKQDPSISWIIIQQFAKAKGLFKRRLLQKKPPHLLFQFAKSAFEKNLTCKNIGQTLRNQKFIHKFNINKFNYSQFAHPKPHQYYGDNSIPLYKMKIPSTFQKNYQTNLPLYKGTEQRQYTTPQNLQREDTPQDQDQIYERNRSVSEDEQKSRKEQNLLFTLSGKGDKKRSVINIQTGREKMRTEYNKQSSQDSLL